VQVDQSSITELAELTNFTPQDLKEIEFLVKAKKQIIFEGPPGTGKTHVAELFARYFSENQLQGSHDDKIVVVQFHQSYGYEDFVQGIRPDTNAKGQLEYRGQNGIFKYLCEVAERNPDKNFVIVIDEINRGNISELLPVSLPDEGTDGTPQLIQTQFLPTAHRFVHHSLLKSPSCDEA
jgi:5-methylcytosine-specific restriction protein B